MLTYVVCKHFEILKQDLNMPAVLAVSLIFDVLILTTLAAHL